jgi:pimeloyl-ACP methyl ester carboxylesterase
MQLQAVRANGVELHYLSQGQGVPVVLVHGGLADYREWAPQIERFARHFRVVAYSRRYNYPNQVPALAPDHSALVEAADLAAFLRALDLAPSHVVGYSYGAFTALCLALAHPELVRALALAEPPILRWAASVPGGAALLTEFLTSFWERVGNAFRRGEPELALRRTAEFFIGPGAYDQLPAEDLQGWQENLGEWEALTTSRDAFPLLAQDQVAQLQLPTLLLTGERTLPIHQLVNAELERLLPHAQRACIRDATHGMWGEQPELCGETTLQFLRSQDGGVLASSS